MLNDRAILSFCFQFVVVRILNRLLTYLLTQTLPKRNFSIDTPNPKTNLNLKSKVRSAKFLKNTFGKGKKLQWLHDENLTWDIYHHLSSKKSSPRLHQLNTRKYFQKRSNSLFLYSKKVTKHITQIIDPCPHSSFNKFFKKNGQIKTWWISKKPTAFLANTNSALEKRTPPNFSIAEVIHKIYSNLNQNMTGLVNFLDLKKAFVGIVSEISAMILHFEYSFEFWHKHLSDLTTLDFWPVPKYFDPPLGLELKIEKAGKIQNIVILHITWSKTWRKTNLTRKLDERQYFQGI